MYDYNDRFNNVGKLFVVMMLLPLAMSVSFFFIAGAYWLIAWSFDFEFVWKHVIGVWVVWIILRSLFKNTN